MTTKKNPKCNVEFYEMWKFLKQYIYYRST